VSAQTTETVTPDSINEEFAKACPRMTPELQNQIESFQQAIYFKLTEHDKPIPSMIADYIQTQSELFLHTLRDTDEIYRYDEPSGCWRPDGEPRIKQFVKELVQKFPNIIRQLSTHKMYEVIHHIRWGSYVDRPFFVPPEDYICLRNGVLNLKTGELKQHSPSYGFLNQIPVTYDPNAKCENIDAFLTEVAPKYKDTLYDLLGYCLTSGNKMQRALLLIGYGSNGKSTFLNLAKTFLGPQNISARGLQELTENRFAVADLFGKLANIYADLPSRPVYDLGKFKAVTGGDTVTGEHKFAKEFVFENGAKLIFSCNILPESKDDSDAFYRRWILIPFTKTIENEDKDYIKKLTTDLELSGLLNQVIVARKRLLERGGFDDDKDVDIKRRLYNKLSDPITSFIDDFVEFVDQKEAPVVKQLVFQEFQKYAKAKRYGQVYSQRTFFKTFMEKAPVGSISDTWVSEKDEDGKVIATHRVYRGIRLLLVDPSKIQPSLDDFDKGDA